MSYTDSSDLIESQQTNGSEYCTGNAIPSLAGPGESLTNTIPILIEPLERVNIDISGAQNTAGIKSVKAEDGEAAGQNVMGTINLEPEGEITKIS